MKDVLNAPDAVGLSLLMADSDDLSRNLACLPMIPFVAEAPRPPLSVKSSAEAGENRMT